MQPPLDSLSLGQLTETLLSGPHGHVDDFELTGSGVKDENGLVKLP